MYELKALYFCLTAMGLADGNLDEDEKQVIFNAMVNLPGAQDSRTQSEWEVFFNDANTTSPSQHLNILKSMHAKKKNTALGALGVLALADGEMDDTELQMWGGIKAALDS